MRRALGAKMKLEFVDGTIPPVLDEFDPTYRSFNRCNMLVLSWILNSVSPSISQSIIFMDNAIDVWNDLKERFSQGDLVRVSELMQEIYALQQDSKSVTTFYSELKILWEELEIYIPIPSCSCRHQCVCDAMRNARKNHLMLYAMRFLTGLNENFSMVKSQILLMDPLPSMNKIFSMVLQHERQGNLAPIDDSVPVVNAINSGKHKGNYPGNSSKNPNPNFGKPRICTFCGRSGHTVETCYQKYGFPPHFQRNSRAGPSANHAASTDNVGENVDSSDHPEAVPASPTITTEQYEK